MEEARKEAAAARRECEEYKVMLPSQGEAERESLQSAFEGAAALQEKIVSLQMDLSAALTAREEAETKLDEIQAAAAAAAEAAAAAAAEAAAAVKMQAMARGRTARAQVDQTKKEEEERAIAAANARTEHGARANGPVAGD